MILSSDPSASPLHSASTECSFVVSGRHPDIVIMLPFRFCRPWKRFVRSTQSLDEVAPGLLIVSVIVALIFRTQSGCNPFQAQYLPDLLPKYRGLPYPRPPYFVTSSEALNLQRRAGFEPRENNRNAGLLLFGTTLALPRMLTMTVLAICN